MGVVKSPGGGGVPEGYSCKRRGAREKEQRRKTTGRPKGGGGVRTLGGGEEPGEAVREEAGVVASSPDIPVQVRDPIMLC